MEKCPDNDRSLHRLLNRLDVFIGPLSFSLPFPDGKSVKMGGGSRRCFNNRVSIYTKLLDFNEKLGEKLGERLLMSW